MSQAGIINVSGQSGVVDSVAGTAPIQANGMSGSPQTGNVDVSITAATAGTSMTALLGAASFNSSDFTVVNGFVSSSGSSGITTIDGDTGYITGSTVTIRTNQVANNSGQTILLSGNDVTTMTLNVTDSAGNTLLGNLSGNASIVGAGGSFNTALGKLSLGNISDGALNTTIGYEAGTAMTGDSLNVAVGALSMYLASNSDANTAVGYKTLLVTTGSNNIAVGYQAGINYVSSESSNIVIGNSGTVSESNVTRIGTQGSSTGQQNKCFIAGIVGVTAANPELTTINSSTGQMGVVASSNNGVLITSNTGVPSLLANSGTAGYVLTSNSGGPPSWQAAGGGGNATAFYAYCSANIDNVLGVSNIYTILFDNSTVRNDGSAYNSGTGLYTAAATGMYSFTTTVGMLNVSSATSLVIGYLGSRQSQVLYSVGAGSVNGSGNWFATAAWVMKMTAGDTIGIQVYSNQAVQNGNIAGSALSSSQFTGYSSFSGYFIGT